MKTESFNADEFQAAIAAIFDDDRGPVSILSEKYASHQNESPDQIIDHGSMMKYDASRDWTKTAPAIAEKFSPREVNMATTVTSAQQIEKKGLSGFLNTIAVKLGMNEATSSMHAAAKTR